jgi:hypothetical protein
LPAVKVSDLKVGQEIESDIKFHNGIVLFKAAEKISSKHIKALKAWGFTEVGVVDRQSVSPLKNAGNSDPASDSTIEHIFLKTNQEDPVIVELKRISLNLKNSR